MTRCPDPGQRVPRGAARQSNNTKVVVAGSGTQRRRQIWVAVLPDLGSHPDARATLPERACHPMRWLLTKALHPYVLMAAAARAARAAAEPVLFAAGRPTLNEQLAASEGENCEIQVQAEATQLWASVSDPSAGLATDELTRKQDLLAAGYTTSAHPATWW